MSVSKYSLLEKAVDIAKEYARSGNSTPSVEIILERVYKKLIELNEDVKSED